MTTNPQHKQEEGFFSFNFFTNCCANDRGADEFSDVDSSSRFNDASGVGTGREDEVGIVSGDNINYDRQSEYGSGNPDWTDVEDYQYQSDPNVSLPGTYVTYNHSQQHDVDYAPQQEPLDLDCKRLLSITFRHQKEEQ